MVSTTHVATKKLCYDSLDGILLNPEKRFALYLKITDSYIINLRVAKGPATRNDFVNDIVDDARAEGAYLCSPVPMFPEPMFPGAYVPRYLCSPVPMFPGFCCLIVVIRINRLQISINRLQNPRSVR